MTPPNKLPASENRAELPIKDWVTKVKTEHQIRLQSQIVTFLLRADGLLLTATIAIFLLEGFKLGGFQLDSALVKWLGGATVGGVGGLLTLTFGAVFKKFD